MAASALLVVAACQGGPRERAEAASASASSAAETAVGSAQDASAAAPTLAAALAERLPSNRTASECAAVVPGDGRLVSSGEARRLRVFVPPGLDGDAGASARPVPLVFLWHGYGDSAAAFATSLRAADLARDLNAILVFPLPAHPLARGGLPTWPFVGDDAHELAFFDDALACLAARFAVDGRRVVTAGFSAGALWSTRLLGERSDAFSAAAVFSGGTSEAGISAPRYRKATSPVPVLVAWGGAQDVYAETLRFDETSRDFVQHLRSDGHLVMACDHGQGHTVPRDAPRWALQFVLAQQRGTAPVARGIDGRNRTVPPYCSLM